MAPLPERRDQVRLAHSRLIHQIVAACQNAGALPAAEESLRVADANGWDGLAASLQRILDGRRDSAALLQGLDEEDSIIVESVLAGLQDPGCLPPAGSASDPSFAAPGIAGIVVAARRGDQQALQWLGLMATQMQHSGGDMAKIGACLGPLSRGQNSVLNLGKGMGHAGCSLLYQILEEITKLQPQ